VKKRIEMEEERPEQSQRERRKLAKHIQDTDTLKKHYKIYKKRKHEHRFISINPHHLEEPIEEYPDSNYVTPRRNNYNKSLYSHS
jgi:t-SNARE complex subunit (syntaxin)